MQQNNNIILLGAVLFVGLLVGAGAGYYFGYDNGWEGAVAESAKTDNAATVNPYADVETNPLQDVKTNPYEDVKLNPFD